MDKAAAAGRVGLLATIPEGYAPGSDVGNMSLLGYDPRNYFTGRAPIEAASMGIPIGPDDVAFRCNLVTIDDWNMTDYSAGHISTPVAHRVINALQEALGTSEMRFFPGVSYRHLLTIKNFGAKLECTPPHDITGKPVNHYFPQGKEWREVLILMDRAKEIIAKVRDEINSGAGGDPARQCRATDIWLWGQGPAVTFPTLQERYGLTGSVISAVDLVRGLGKLSGLTIRLVEGATGYLGTNYAGKVSAAINAFESGEDFVFLHIEAPDETSHEGDLKKKLQAIEEFDKNVVGEMLKYQSQNPNLRIAVTPDHVTALSTRTHDASPVPFCMCGPGVRVDGADQYNEKSARDRVPVDGTEFFEALIKEG
jgi:2,3-bisphosphoglycerate-independent phosphoglycerate mutase